MTRKICFRTSGIVIRNGVIYRDNGARQGLAIYRDGTMALYDEKTTTAQELPVSPVEAKKVWPWAAASTSTG